MSGTEKAEVLTKVTSSGLPKRRALGELGVPRSTYYRWLRRKEQQGLEDDIGASPPPWNKLASQEIDSVLTAAREMPELSCRQLAWARISASDASASMRTASPRPLPHCCQTTPSWVSGQKLPFRRHEGPAVLRRVAQRVDGPAGGLVCVGQHQGDEGSLAAVQPLDAPEAVAESGRGQRRPLAQNSNGPAP